MKKTTFLFSIASLALFGVGLPLLWRSPNTAAQADAALPAAVLPAAHILEEPIQPIPLDTVGDAGKVELGRKLFHDKRLSKDNTVACATCHDLGRGGTDQLAHSIGINGAAGGINAPTVLNSGLNFVQFWNGRAATLEDQVNGPTHHPKEMGSNWKEIVGKLQQDAGCVADFKRLYGTGVQPQHIRDAIATFERSLNTVNAPFDRYLRGETGVLSNQAKAGYRLFKSYGCASCHQGRNVGGNMYQKFGVMADYFKFRGNETDADQGRCDVTKREQDRHVFRVPSLRNIALTHPYFHDGSVTTLTQAVEIMAKYQLGRYLTVNELAQLVAFLESLTGEVRGEVKGASR